jgi:hypothetical protein
MIGIVVAACGKFRYADTHGAAMALGNIMASVACRNEFFIRYFLYWPLVHAFQKVREHHESGSFGVALTLVL